MFRRCLVFLIVAVTVSSFAPSMTKTRRSDRVDGYRQKHQTSSSSSSWSMASLHETGVIDERIASSQRMNKDRPRFSLPVIGRGILASSLIFGSVLFVSLDPTAAMASEFQHEQPIRAAEPITSISASTSASASASASTISNSFLTISDYPTFPDPSEIRVQQKYLDLAGELKEELKFRGKQAKEKGAEVAKEVQEKQQAGADKRAAKVKEYDDMFDQSANERDQYYSQKVISRETYLQDLRKQDEGKDRSDYDQMMYALSPEATAVEGLKYRLGQNVQEENRLRASLVANSKKDPDDRNTKVERTLLKISIEKTELQSSKIRKDITVEESLEIIRLQRQAEVRVYQERGEQRERDKQEKLDSIRLANERQREFYEDLRAKKKAETEELKFLNAQTFYELRFDDLDRFEQRKDILGTKAREKDATDTKGLMDQLNRLAAEGEATNNAKALEAASTPQSSKKR